MSTATLTTTEKNVLKKIELYVSKDEKVSINKIAKEAFVSPATIIKLSKKLGHSGYSELCYYLRTINKNNSISVDFNDFKGIITNSNNLDIKTLAEILYRNKNSTYLLASCGFCDSAKDYLLQKLWLFGLSAMDTYHEKAIENTPQSKGFFFIFSESGELPSLVEITQIAKKQGYKIILFTSSKDCKLSTISDISIIIESTKNDKIESYKANFFTAKIIVFIELLFEEYSKIIK